MKKIYTSILLFFVLFNAAQAQMDYSQYFDGADTIFDPNIFPSSIRVVINPDSGNIWQVGAPQKHLFDSASTLPNALVTDTLNSYPPNNSSSVQFTIKPWINFGIMALQWKQKLDMDAGLDGGLLEFSVDAGATWQNAFTSPYVYNFYGYQVANADTLANGVRAFSGTDSLWRDVWLCYDMSWLTGNDSITVRFTFSSDSIDNQKEGWMIDNLLAHITIFHTVKEVEQKDYLMVYPNPSNDIVHIQAQKLNEFHIIEQMELMDQLGRVVDRWTNVPTRFWFDTKKYANGVYALKIKTNIKSETLPLILNNR